MSVKTEAFEEKFVFGPPARTDPGGKVIEPGIWEHPRERHRFEVRLVSEAEGGYSVYCPQLPGALSQGETREEAIQNIREALAGVIASYKKKKEAIPLNQEIGYEGLEGHPAWVTVDA